MLMKVKTTGGLDDCLRGRVTRPPFIVVVSRRTTLIIDVSRPQAVEAIAERTKGADQRRIQAADHC